MNEMLRGERKSQLALSDCTNISIEVMSASFC